MKQSSRLRDRQRRAQHPSFFVRICLAALLPLCALTSIDSAVASSQAGDSAPSDALWIATQFGPAKLATDGSGDVTPLADDTRPLAVAVDEIDGKAWFYDSRVLRGYDFFGRLQLAVDLNPAVPDNART